MTLGYYASHLSFHWLPITPWQPRASKWTFTLPHFLSPAYVSPWADALERSHTVAESSFIQLADTLSCCLWQRCSFSDGCFPSVFWLHHMNTSDVCIFLPRCSWKLSAWFINSDVSVCLYSPSKIEAVTIGTFESLWNYGKK